MIDMDEADEMNLEVACRETEEYPVIASPRDVSEVYNKSKKVKKYR